jgi:AraC-like DNA-binding protein
MKFEKSQFHSSLSVHKGWLDLYEEACAPYGIEAANQSIRINNDHRLHLYDLRDEIYRLVDESKDPLFAVHCASNVSPLTFGSFSLACWTAPDLHSALQLIAEHSIMMCSPVRVEYHTDKQGNGELWIFNSEALSKESYATYMGITLFKVSLVKMMQAIVRDSKMIIEVELIANHFGSKLLCEIEQLTQTTITVGHPIQKLRVEKKYLYRDNKQQDPDIHFSTLNLLRNQAEKLRKHDVILQIYNTLTQLNDLSNVSAESVSHALNMNVRTLNRRLFELNTSYRGVLEKYKLEKALYLLSDSNVNMTEIAFQLGFADLSTFSRAFKRWTGVSPIVLKEKLQKVE